jgi:hypothetical protein
LAAVRAPHSAKPNPSASQVLVRCGTLLEIASCCLPAARKLSAALRVSFSMWQWLVGMVACTLALAGCDGTGSEGDGTQAGSLVDCAADSMHLKGEIEGTAVDRTEGISGGGLTQVGEGHFDSMYVGRELIDDPERSWVVLYWPSGIEYGAESNARGTLMLPGSEPHGADALCAGEGTFVGFDDAGVFYFGLRSLSAGDACDAPIAGSVDGCWYNAAE